ncbi:MAG: hypothetical protein ABEJ44_07095 [Halanaeroarchaeum sp.]
MSDDDSEEPLGDLREEVDSRTGREDSGPSGDGSDHTPPEAAPDEPAEEKGGDASPEEEGPLGDLRRDVESRKAEGESPSDRPGTGNGSQPGDPFVEQDVDDVDTDELWADLLFEDEEPPTGSFEAADETDAPGTVVSKSLCHRCQYFGDPPQLHCTHEGTTIHELVDMDHYRVTDCPMVDEDVEEQS